MMSVTMSAENKCPFSPFSSSRASISSSLRSRRPVPTISTWETLTLFPELVPYSFASRPTISSAESEETSEEASNISVPNSFASRSSISSRYRATSRSRSVVVGEFRITVSDSRAASNIFAVGSSGFRPLALKRSMISVAVEPTGSKVAGMGEVVWSDGQGILAHDLPAGNGELYQAARHVRIEWREQYGRPPLPGHLQDLIFRTHPVGDDEYAGAKLYGPPLAPRTVPDHHDVARLHGLPHGGHAHRDDPQLSRGLTVFLPDQKLTLEHLGHRPDRDRALGESGSPARLPHVHARQVPLCDDPGERAVIFHYWQLANVPPGHSKADVA